MSLTKSPRSADQIAASRANGAKSHGPTSPEGKAKVSLNRMTHGFRSAFVCLAKEDKPAYDAHLDSYLARYSPVDKVESDLVGLLASTIWQVMRYDAVEVALADLEDGSLDNEELRNNWLGMNNYGRMALAFKNSVGHHSMELLLRYKTASRRAYDRLYKTAEEMLRNRQKPVEPPAETAAPAPVQAEPAAKKPEISIQTQAPSEPLPQDDQKPSNILPFSPPKN